MSIRALFHVASSAANNSPVTDSKRAKITDEHRQEAMRLRALWDARSPKRTQAEFGEEFELGNQANVGHYLHARSALNPKAASAFARGLRCRVEDFSPRVALELLTLSTPPTLDADHSRSAAAAVTQAPAYGADPVQPSPTIGATILQLGALLATLSPMGLKSVAALVEEVLKNPASAREAAETADAIARTQRMPVSDDFLSRSFGRAQENPVETGFAPLEPSA